MSDGLVTASIDLEGVKLPSTTLGPLDATDGHVKLRAWLAECFPSGRWVMSMSAQQVLGSYGVDPRQYPKIIEAFKDKYTALGQVSSVLLKRRAAACFFWFCSFVR